MARTTDNPLDRYMRFRCTEGEGARLMRLAQSRSLTFSEFARRQLLNRPRIGKGETAAPAGATASPADHEAKALAFQIQKVGINLNQIVKAMHTHQTPPPPELRGLLDDIRRYVRAAQRLPRAHEP